MIVFDEIEYTITATCYDKNTFAERESIWDSIARSFRLIGPAKPRTPLGKIEPTKPRSPASKLERANQAVQFAERGHSYFNSSQYQQALEEFEKGKMVTHEVPWNFLGASMTYMQMVVTGAVPEDQVIIYVERAEKNIQACLLISPRDQVYLDAKRNIEDYRKRHNI